MRLTACANNVTARMHIDTTICTVYNPRRTYNAVTTTPQDNKAFGRAESGRGGTGRHGRLGDFGQWSGSSSLQVAKAADGVRGYTWELEGIVYTILLRIGAFSSFMMIAPDEVTGRGHQPGVQDMWRTLLQSLRMAVLVVCALGVRPDVRSSRVLLLAHNPCSGC